MAFLKEFLFFVFLTFFVNIKRMLIEVAMYEIIRNKEKILKNQKILEDAMHFQTDVYPNREIGYPGGRHKCDVYWSSNLDFWSAHDIANEGKLFQNIFGFGEPVNEKLAMTGGINLSLSGGNSGGILFHKNGTEKVFLGHTGNIREFRTNKEKNEKFWNIFKDKCIDIAGKNIIFIGELPSEQSKYLDFQNNVKEFIEKSRTIKNIPEIIQEKLPINNNTNTKIAILIKKSKDDEFENKIQYLSEHKLEIINKAFKYILPVLAKYICNILQEYDKNNWWSKYVLGKLPDNVTRDLPRNGSLDNYINKLDISVCLKIIIQNWHEIFKQKMNNIKLSWVHELLEIRNEDSHWTVEKLNSFSVNDLIRALDTMILFMRSIDISVSEKINGIKEEFVWK